MGDAVIMAIMAEQAKQPAGEAPDRDQDQDQSLAKKLASILNMGTPPNLQPSLRSSPAPLAGVGQRQRHLSDRLQRDLLNQNLFAEEFGKDTALNADTDTKTNTHNNQSLTTRRVGRHALLPAVVARA